MAYAIIENGTVSNIVVADAAFAASQGWIPSSNWAIGDLWDGATFTTPPAPPLPVPQNVSRRQFKLALLDMELLDDVEALVDTSADRALQINYSEALDFDRHHPFVLAVAQALGKADAEIDALFILAYSKT